MTDAAAECRRTRKARVDADIAARRPMQHMVVTGRAAPQALIDSVDTVSDIGDLKHAFRAGVRAQSGIDW